MLIFLDFYPEIRFQFFLGPGFVRKWDNVRNDDFYWGELNQDYKKKNHLTDVILKTEVSK